MTKKQEQSLVKHAQTKRRRNQTRKIQRGNKTTAEKKSKRYNRKPIFRKQTHNKACKLNKPARRKHKNNSKSATQGQTRWREEKRPLQIPMVRRKSEFRRAESRVDSWATKDRLWPKLKSLMRLSKSKSKYLNRILKSLFIRKNTSLILYWYFFRST